MKEEYLSTDNEPALQGGNRVDPLKSDPSEEIVTRREAHRRNKPPAEIDRIRDCVASEPALAGSGGASGIVFREWLENRRSRVGIWTALFVAVGIGVLAGPFALIGALTKGPSVSVGMLVYAVLFAPIMEEFLKQSGMVYILERRPYLAKAPWQFPVAAVIAAGIFATVENLIYLHIYGASLSESSRDALARFRWPVCTCLHVTCALIASFGLVRVWNRQSKEGRPAQLSHAFPLFVVAIAIHGIYNFTASIFIEIGE